MVATVTALVSPSAFSAQRIKRDFYNYTRRVGYPDLLPTGHYSFRRSSRGTSHKIRKFTIGDIMSYIKNAFNHFILYFWQYIFFASILFSLLGSFGITNLSEVEKAYHGLISLIALAVIDIRRDLEAKI